MGWSEPVVWLRAASRRARSSRRVTRLLFGADVDRGVHGDLWDATTLTLRKALLSVVRDGDRVLELGTGHVGVLSVLVATRRRVEVVAVDVSPAFVDNARRVAARSGAGDVDFRVSDWFSAVEGPFDVVFSNLPYVPTATGARLGAHAEHRQVWDGGADGLDPARVILAAAPRFLSQRGRLLLGINRMYASREALARAIDASPELGLERTVRTLLSPGEVFVAVHRTPTRTPR